MGVSEEQQKKTQESQNILNEKNAQRLHAFADKIVAFRDPVLVIGLGGTGIDAMLATKKLVYEKISGKQPLPSLIADRPRSIEYLGIDTDETSLNKSCQGIGLNQEDDEILICPYTDWSSVAAHSENLPGNISSWLDPALADMNKEESQPQTAPIRQMGRLTLILHVEKVTAVLEKKINRVTKEFAPETVLWVFLITGLCGGTGSGMLLDVAYLVRAVASAQNPRSVRIVGNFFLPEVNTSIPDIPWDMKQRLTANGYASLRELDQLMSAENAGDVYAQDYGLPRDDMQVEGTWKPFDFCLLYANRDMDGENKESEKEFAFLAYDSKSEFSSYDLAISAVAGTILTLITGHEDTECKNNENPETGNESTGTDACGLARIHQWAANECKKQLIYQQKQKEEIHSASYGYTLVNLSCFGYEHLVEDRMKAEAEADIPKLRFRNIVGREYNFDYFKGNCSELIDVVSVDDLMTLYQNILLEQIYLGQKNLDKLEEVLIDYIMTDCAEIPDNQEHKLQYRDYGYALQKELGKYRDYLYKIKSHQSKMIDSLQAQEPEARHKAEKGFFFRKRRMLAYKDLAEQLYRAMLDVWVCEELLIFCANAGRLIDKQFLGMKKLPDIPADFFLEIFSRFRKMSMEQYFSTIVNEICEKTRKQDNLIFATLNPDAPSDASVLSGSVYLTIPMNPAGWRAMFEKACASINREKSIGKDGVGIYLEGSESIDNILAVHFQDAVPLIALKNIKMYENAYMEIRDKSVGLHLYRAPQNEEKPFNEDELDPSSSCS
ncbi:MAG: tubulin-like doman-containing protein [Lachnospiraceae bacterium]|nr:tubulin-like doman-containing protein [Lachnospiraceae bacterium]